MPIPEKGESKYKTKPKEPVPVKDTKKSSQPKTNPPPVVSGNEAPSANYFNRNLAEFSNLSQGIFQKSNDFMKKLQELGFEKEQVMADLKQEQFIRNLSERKKDVGLQQKLTEMGLSNLPTGGDIFLQSFMGGAGIGFDYFSKNKESQNQYKGLMDLLNDPGGNSPFGNFGVDSPIGNSFNQGNYG